MSKFKIGDEIVCVKCSGTNWYSIGDVHVISSDPISAWDEETCEDYIGYNILAFADNHVWIDSRDFDLIVEEPAFAQCDYAAAFNMWMDDYMNNPQAYEDSHDSAVRHLKEKLNGEEPSYGAVCAEVLVKYLNKLESK